MNLNKLFLSVICASLSATAFADTADIKTSNNQLGIQATSTHVDYTETGNGALGSQTGTLDTENGNVPGFALSLSVMKDWWLGNDYIEAGYSRNKGDTNYVGGTANGSTPYGSLVGQDGAVIEDYHLRYGKGFVLGNQFMLTPYFEIGHHRWDRAVNAGEIYANRYYGIGALGQYSPVHKLVLTANVFGGGTYGSNIDAAGVFSGSLGNSALFKAGLAADYAFTQNLHGNVGVDYTSFKYGMSAFYPRGGGYVWEPDSTTNYTTLKIGLGYAF
ncbi:MAG: hypothetical protein ACYC43_06790 [Burkholderiales bacterium]